MEPETWKTHAKSRGGKFFAFWILTQFSTKQSNTLLL